MNATPPFVLPSAKPLNAVRLDGRGRDPVWARAAAFADFTAYGQADAPATGTQVRLVRVGTWLLARIEAQEPDGYVAREGVHGADPWFDDELGLEAKGAHALKIYVNPFGTVWCQADGKTSLQPFYAERVLAAPHLEDGRWAAEFAIDLRALGVAGDEIEVAGFRQRQARGFTPYRESVAPAKDRWIKVALGDAWQNAENVRIDAVPPEPMAGRASLAAARVENIPADREAWLRVPPVLLREDTGRVPVDPAFQATVVRVAVSNRELALNIFSREAFPDSIENPGQALWKEDNLELFFGPEAYPYLQVITAPNGKADAAIGQTGGKRVKSIPIPKEIAVEVAKADGGWVATVRIPFAAIASTLAMPALHPDVFPWRLQVTRNRPARGKLGQAQQTSLLAVTNSATAHCPLRYALLHLVAPLDAPAVDPELPRVELPKPVLETAEREKIHANELVAQWANARRNELFAQWQAAFDKIDSAENWNTFAGKARADLKKLLFPGTEGVAPERTPLNAKIVYEREGDGFKVLGLIFEARPGIPEPATLFVPKEPAKDGAKRPALIVLPAHHTPRHSADLYFVGANLARAGGIAMLMDTIGSGECSTVARWEHKTYQRCETGVQLALAGEEISGVIAWSISRAVDYLLERGDADAGRIGVLGGVAGGGDLAAVAAAWDERITLCVPFNFSNCRPFGGYYDTPRALAGSNVTGLHPWMVDALVAPRQLIQAQEFTWENSCKDSYARFEKVYGWLGKPGNLSFLHGGVETHATHFNGLHRRPMYKILNDWWKLALPVEEKDEFKASFNSGELECFTSTEGRAYLEALRNAGRLRDWNVFAKQAAQQRLESARKQRGEKPQAVREALERVCGPSAVAPEKVTDAPERDEGVWRGAKVSGYWLPVEPVAKELESPVGVAVWLLHAVGDGPRPLVVGVAQAGKASFLAERAADVERFLKAGVSVALVDPRGFGETSPGTSRSPESAGGDLASALWNQYDSLPARQLKDFRTALNFLARLPGVDASRVAFWGEGLTEPNGVVGQALLFDETGFRQSGPLPMKMVEPTGGWLALSGALFEFEDAKGAACRPRSVLVRGSVHAYLSVLDRRFHYLPSDALIPGLLREIDMADEAREAKALGVEVLAEDLRDGSNRSVDAALLKETWGAATPEGYSTAPTSAVIARVIAALKK